MASILLALPSGALADQNDPLYPRVWGNRYQGTYVFRPSFDVTWMKQAVKNANATIGHSSANDPDFHKFPPGMLALALLVGACGAGAAVPGAPAQGGPSGRSAPPVASTPSPAGPPASPSPPAGAHGHEVVVGIGFAPYRSLTDEARLSEDGVAIVEIVSVGEPRWSTPTGERPPEELLHQGVPPGWELYVDGVTSGYGIGRLVTVRLVRMLRSEWPSPTSEAGFWRPGGTVGQDRQESFGYLYPPLTPAMAGRQALALLVPPNLLGEPPTIPISIARLYPADEQDRIITPLGVEEGVTLENVESFLP